jgi:hypothetical protein
VFNNLNRNSEVQINTAIWQDSGDFNRAVSDCLARVFLRMFSALLATAAAAYIVASSETLINLIFGTPLFYVLLFAPIGLVIAISAGLQKMSAATATLLFYVYAVLMGATLASVLLLYDLGTIFQAFGIAGVMFACMAVYGITTKKDLSSWGSILFMGLIGVVIAMVVNLFMRSDAMSFLISFIAVIVFVGLTAYDTQKIRNMLGSAVAENQTEAIQKISVFGALVLYLDFINLFLHVLRLLGRRS